MSLNERQHSRHAGYDAEVDVIPPSDEVLVRKIDAQRLTQRREVGRRWNLSSLVLFVRVVDRESLREQARITTRPRGPYSESSSKVEVDDDAPEIEQQGTNLPELVGEQFVHSIRLADGARRRNSDPGSPT